MRQYSEPTARNLLRAPLVLGVPLGGILALSVVVLSISTLSGTALAGNLIALGVGVVGYLGLRVLERFALNGWDQSLLWWVERWLFRLPAPEKGVTIRAHSFPVQAPDTLDEADLIRSKEDLSDVIKALRSGERHTVLAKMTAHGTQLFRVDSPGFVSFRGKPDWRMLSQALFTGSEHVYSLHSLPVFTDPLWLFSVLKDLPTDIRVLTSFRGVDARALKRRIEVSRRRTSRVDSGASAIDSEITFEEASEVLRGISRGDEQVLEASLVIISKESLDLDPEYFVREKTPGLTVASVIGLRRNLHRKHVVRLSTACDLIPNILDPVDLAAEILKTPRGNPLYFSPNDARLEALHWLVVGATGSGKSFFTGLVLKRMIEGGEKLSVVFLDHNRSFRRLVRAQGGRYLELQSLAASRNDIVDPIVALDSVGAMTGIELSDLNPQDKKAAIRAILSQLETFLRVRESTHPVYLVLDECWNFLRDEPVLVQRAFREFRKLNGAVVAITQSLSDFVTTQTGQTIFQNAPVRILLRQGEDLSQFRGALALNDVELNRLRLLRQVRGEFSECLIKTPYLSRLGRLYPTDAEHELLRTDNLREEWVKERRQITPRPSVKTDKWARLTVFPYVLLLMSVFAHTPDARAAFGLEMGPLLKLVAGQVTEIERLTQQLGVARENQELLFELNRGIDKTVSQIRSVEAVLERAQGLDPQAVRSISELNVYLSRTREAKRVVEEMMELRSEAASIAIQQSALQGETAYLMGQEMMATGASLAHDSRLASPGRAAQITAASSSAQMLAQGVQLQTLSQIAQLQAMQLELFRSQLEQQRIERKQQDDVYRQVVNLRKGRATK